MPRLRPNSLLVFAVAAMLGLFSATTPDTASAQLAGPGFGSSTAVAGGHVIVGEPNSVRRPGTAYVYATDGEAWMETGRLTAADGTDGDRFGHSIAVSADRMMVGAPVADDGQGAAYVFERASGSWKQVARLSAPDGAVGFGISVALDGGRALVATEDGDLLSMAGVVEGFVGPAAREIDASAVHAFDLGGDGSWSHAGILSPGGDAAGIGFGHSMAIANGTAYIGAAKHKSLAGAVFVFEATEDGWNLASEVSGKSPGAGFGYSVTMTEAGQLLVGAPMEDGPQGQVFEYGIDAETGEWSERAKLRPEAGGVGQFGGSVATSGSDVWVAAIGSAYATSYDSDSGTWSERVQLDVEEGAGTIFFAGSVALGDGVGSFGFKEDDFGAGSGTIFTSSDDGWVVEGMVAGELDGMVAISGDEIRCEDGSAEGFDCESVDLLSFVPTGDLGSARGVNVNDIWGWTDPDTGREYALVGRNDGTAFVDVTDPGQPVYVGELPRTEGSPEAAWRDVKTYENYALIVADASGAHGMQVFDLTRLRGVDNMPATFEPDVTYDGFGSSHNIIVNEETAYAYAVTGECGGGLHMVNVSDPLNPQGEGCYTHTGSSPLDSFTHDSQCVAYHGSDTDYQGREVCFTSGIMGLLISDMTDHASPVTLGVGQVPNAALPHQGWLTEDHQYFLLGDEGDEMQGLVDNTRTLIWDVTDLDDPVLLTEYFGPTKAADHNLYVNGNLVYQANYDSGLRIVDITNIAEPQEVGFFDTVPHGADEPSFRLGAWSVYPYFKSGVIVVSSGGEGLFVLRYQPQEPVS
jgi:choice-of-anchor B domain-containing protein